MKKNRVLGLFMMSGLVGCMSAGDLSLVTAAKYNPYKIGVAYAGIPSVAISLAGYYYWTNRFGSYSHVYSKTDIAANTAWSMVTPLITNKLLTTIPTTNTAKCIKMNSVVTGTATALFLNTTMPFVNSWVRFLNS